MPNVKKVVLKTAKIAVKGAIKVLPSLPPKPARLTRQGTEMLNVTLLARVPAGLVVSTSKLLPPQAFGAVWRTIATNPNDVRFSGVLALTPGGGGMQ